MGFLSVNTFYLLSAAVLRRIPGKVFSAEEMAIPKELLDLCFLPLQGAPLGLLGTPL